MEKIGHIFKHTAHCYISHVYTNENFGKTLHEAKLGSPYVKKRVNLMRKNKMSRFENLVSQHTRLTIIRLNNVKKKPHTALLHIFTDTI